MNNFYGGRKGKDFQISGLIETYSELSNLAALNQLEESGFYIITTPKDLNNEIGVSHMNEIWQWSRAGGLSLVFKLIGVESGATFEAPDYKQYNTKEEINQ